MSRRKSRILAFQGLYSIEVGNNSLEDVLRFDWNNSQLESEQDSDNSGSEKSQEEIPSENIVYARMLVSGTMEHLGEIDEIIKMHLKSWDISRVNKVSLSILRMSVYSLKYQPELLPSIVIDEAIHLAKSFGPSDSFKFVNAILDNIKKYVNKTNESKI
nr:transcription antitermination factor NusB [Treponema sp.]